MNSNVFEFKNGITLICFILAIWLFFYSLNTKKAVNWYIANFIISLIVNNYSSYLMAEYFDIDPFFIPLIFPSYLWAFFSSLIRCYYVNKKIIWNLIIVNTFCLGMICFIGFVVVFLLPIILVIFCWDIGHCLSWYHF